MVTAARENVCDGSDANGETAARDEIPASEESPVNGVTAPASGCEVADGDPGEGRGALPTSAEMSAALKA